MTVSPDLISGYVDSIVEGLIRGVLHGKFQSPETAVPPEYKLIISAIEKRANHLKGTYLQIEDLQGRMKKLEQDIKYLPKPMSLWEKVGQLCLAIIIMVLAVILLRSFVTIAIFDIDAGVARYKVIFWFLAILIPCALFVTSIRWCKQWLQEDAEQRKELGKAEKEFQSVQVQLTGFLSERYIEVAPWKEEVLKLVLQAPQHEENVDGLI